VSAGLGERGEIMMRDLKSPHEKAFATTRLPPMIQQRLSPNNQSCQTFAQPGMMTEQTGEQPWLQVEAPD